MSTEQEKPKWIDKVYFDSKSGEELTIRKYLCRRCGQYVRNDGYGHPACLKEAAAEDAANAEKERQNECIRKYGKVLSRAEEEWRDFPDWKVAGYGETYNEYLARIKRQEREAYYQKLRDRELRKERLARLEQEVPVLKAQVARDEEEKAEEANQKEGNANKNQILFQPNSYKNKI